MGFDFNEFTLSLKNPANANNYSGYEVQTKIENFSLSLDRHSRGKQNMFLLSLIKSTIDNKTIVFFEELEQNLEPINQKKMAKMIKKVAKGQLFITSHSPSLIECFDFNDIFYYGKGKITHIVNNENTFLLKDISRVDKKNYITSIMAKSILLVEGESEQPSLPVYSENFDEVLYNLNMEIFNVRGIDKIVRYCEQFSELGKTLFILVDNDPGVINTIKTFAHFARTVYIAKNDYEDIIYPVCDNILEILEELVEFSKVKNKLVSLLQGSDNNLNKREKSLKEYLSKNDIFHITSYEGLFIHKDLFTYILHDSFTSSYFARIIAASLIKKNIVPPQIKLLFDNLNHNNNLKEFNLDLDNTFLLEEKTC